MEDLEEGSHQKGEVSDKQRKIHHGLTLILYLDSHQIIRLIFIIISLFNLYLLFLYQTVLYIIIYVSIESILMFICNFHLKEQLHVHVLMSRVEF